MTARFTQRLGAAAGVVYAILLMTAGAVGSPTTQPAFAMEVLAFTLFLFFLGSLSSAMRLAEGGGGALSTTAFGAGLMSITIKLGSAAPLLAAHSNSDELGPDVKVALQDMNNASFALTFFPLAATLAAVALVAIRTAALPSWLGWAAAALSVGFAVGGLAGSADLGSEWAGLPMVLFTAWVIAASVVLIRRAGTSTPLTRPAGAEVSG
jgi:hypothetical protein